MDEAAPSESDLARSNIVPSADRLRWTVVCFGSVDWPTYRQRPQWVASELARRGTRVLYINNLGTRLPRAADARRVMSRLIDWFRSTRTQATRSSATDIVCDSPIVLPLQQWRIMRVLGSHQLVKRIQKRIPNDRPLLVWTYLPLPVVRDVARILKADALVYDWSDDASRRGLTRSARHRERLRQWEDEMARDADVLFVASQVLSDRRLRGRRSAQVIPHGVAPRDHDTYPTPAELVDVRRPIIGFVGSIARWTDLKLVDEIAALRPDWTFVLVGPIKVRLGKTQLRSNVIFTGEKQHDEVPAYLSNFDAAIIPYLLIDATVSVNPVKLHEYLSYGLPVVSVDMPEVKRFSPPVRIAEGAEGFAEAIDAALTQKHEAPAGSDVRRTWNETVAEMTETVSSFLVGRHNG